MRAAGRARTAHAPVWQTRPSSMRGGASSRIMDMFVRAARFGRALDARSDRKL